MLANSASDTPPAAEQKAPDSGFQARLEIQANERLKDAWADVRDFESPGTLDGSEKFALGIVKLAATLKVAGASERLHGLEPNEDDARTEAMEVYRLAETKDSANRIAARLRAIESQNVPSFLTSVDRWIRHALMAEILDLPPRFEAPEGWEGHRYHEAIGTLADFGKWLDFKIRCRDHLMPMTELGEAINSDRSSGRDLRNAYRLIDQLRLVDFPPQPTALLTYRDETICLRNLRRECNQRLSDNAPLKGLSATAEGPKDSNGAWLTVAKAAQIAGINKGTISRAVDGGALKSNGKKRRARRIDGADFNRWQLARANKPRPAENDEHVQKLMNRANRS